MHVWGVNGCVGVYRCMGHTDAPVLTIPHMPATNVGNTSLFKDKFPHLNSWKNIREPPDHTGNEATPDITIRGPGQDINSKMTNTCYL